MSAPAALRARFKGSLGAFSFDVAFQTPAQGCTALFGPSGCGKTTTLRCIAGLQRLEGFLSVGGRVWQNQERFLSPHRRAIGYVFQDASLFPHLSVLENLRYGANRAFKEGGGEALRYDDVVDLLGLQNLLNRSPRRLSGGERQRVAIGRALLSKPELLLMDEPLSGLDAEAKDEILRFLQRLQKNLASPILFVTHDLAEVERLAQYVVLMEKGCILASGSLESLQSDLSLPLARRRDAATSLHAVVEGYDPAYGLLSLDVGGTRFFVPGPAHELGERRRLRILAGDVSLAKSSASDSTILNIVSAQILEMTPIDDREIVVLLSLGRREEVRAIARITRRSWDQLALATGDQVFAQVKAVSLSPR